MKHKIKVLIADDHELVRDGLAAAIAYEGDMTCVGKAQDGRQAVQLAEKTRPDVIVMDLMMPVLGGTDATREVTAANPDVRVLVLTSYGSPDELQAALDAGAASVLLKSSPNRDVLAAIRCLSRGKPFVSPEIKALIESRPPTPKLTERQLEILSSVSRGLSNKDIARAFGITSAGVKKHLKLIFDKLGTATRTEAAAKALHDNLLKF